MQKIAILKNKLAELKAKLEKAESDAYVHARYMVDYADCFGTPGATSSAKFSALAAVIYCFKYEIKCIESDISDLEKNS